MTDKDPNNFDQQLDQIEKRYNSSASPAQNKAEQEAYSTVSSGLGLALRAGIDMFSGVVVTAAIGWWLDRHFHLHGICLGIFIFLGGCVGVLNVIRLVTPSSQTEQNERKKSGRKFKN